MPFHLALLEKPHVEHRHRPVQPADRRGMGRALQGDVRIRLRFLEDGDISVFRRWVRTHDDIILFLLLFRISDKNPTYANTATRSVSCSFAVMLLFAFYRYRVATGNPVVFTLSPPECYMEIRYGYGTTGNRVGGPVRVGDPLTLIIYMRSKYGNHHCHYDKPIVTACRYNSRRLYVCASDRVGLLMRRAVGCRLSQFTVMNIIATV